jgi:hypothetical protein
MSVLEVASAMNRAAQVLVRTSYGLVKRIAFIAEVEAVEETLLVSLGWSGEGLVH